MKEQVKNTNMKLPVINLIKQLYEILTEAEKINLEKFVLSKRKERRKKLVVGYSNSVNLNLMLENFFETKNIKYLFN